MEMLRVRINYKFLDIKVYIRKLLVQNLDDR